ncbi:MAG: twin-arginine translocase TatA/TatE family subunit [Acidobacteriota bacterium]
MFENLGFQEIALIAIVFIVFFGPKKIPEVMNGIGRGVREFRRAMNEVKSEISNIADPPYDRSTVHKAEPTRHEEQSSTGA